MTPGPPLDHAAGFPEAPIALAARGIAEFEALTIRARLVFVRTGGRVTAVVLHQSGRAATGCPED